MKYIATLILSCALFFSAPTSYAKAYEFDGKLSEKHKIEILTHLIGHPDLTFIRNGDEHDSAKAKEHVLKKLDYAGSRVKTAQQFIDKICSQSYFSGKPYYIKFPNGKKVASRSWLYRKLAEIEGTVTISRNESYWQNG